MALCAWPNLPKNGKKDEKKERRRKLHSFEDAEGLLINLILIAALILTFLVSVFFTVKSKDWDNAEFRYRLCQSDDFRRYVLKTMNEDVESWTQTFDTKRRHVLPEDYDDQVAYDTLNITELLLTSRGKCYVRGYLVSSGFYPTENCRRLYAAANILLNDFPMPALSAYCGDFYYTSSMAMTYGSWSIILVSCALICCFFLYVSLAMSPAREKAELRDFGSLIKWKQAGLPLALALYLIFIVGTVMFFITISVVGALRSPSAATIGVLMAPPLGFLIPFLAPCFAAGVALFFRSGGSMSYLRSRVPAPADFSECGAVFSDEEENRDLAARMGMHDIQPYMLPELTGDDLQRIGYHTAGRRKQVIAAIAKWRRTKSGRKAFEVKFTRKNSVF